MRDIAIIGSGQAGLLLAIGLLDRGYRVTLVSDRTSEEILHGWVPAGSVVFDDALQVERDLGLDFWDDVAVPCRGVHIDAVGPDGNIVLKIESVLDKPGLCVDQRLKCHRWMDEFQRRGGRLLVQRASIDELETYARQHDLVILATGKGELSRLLPRDEARSPFEKPPRNVSMVVVDGFQGWDDFKIPGSKFAILPGGGEIFSSPFYSKDKIQGMFIGFEAIPGGPLDRFVPGMDAEEQCALAKQIFQEFLPWDYDAIRDTTLVDAQARLIGAVLPVVRKPVGTLPSGAPIMGIADAVNLQDPISAQGANNAAKAARLVTERIVEHGARPFDPAWMTDVFEDFWEHAQYGNRLHDWLLDPPQPHGFAVLSAAARIPAVASRLVNGFNHPPSLFPWIADPAQAEPYLRDAASEPWPAIASLEAERAAYQELHAAGGK